MAIAQSQITLATNGAGTYQFTPHVVGAVQETGVKTGVVTLFCQHTSASLLIQENADPDVQHDLKMFFDRLVREGENWMTHTLEGPDDMPAHIRTALTQTSLSIPISQGRLVLGTWQGIFLFEHRRQAHRREVFMHIQGES